MEKNATNARESKPKLKKDDYRSRRKVFLDDIRKQKKNSLLQKRRKQAEADEELDDNFAKYNHEINGFAACENPLQIIPHDRLLIFLRTMRKLSAGTPSLSNSIIQELVKRGVVPSVLRCGVSTNEEIQKEALWLLANLMQNTRACQTVKTLQALPSVFPALESRNHHVVDSALYIISNYIGEKESWRFVQDLVPSNIFWQGLFRCCCNQKNNLDIAENVLWILQWMAKFSAKTPVIPQKLSQFLPFVETFLNAANNQELVRLCLNFWFKVLDKSATPLQLQYAEHFLTQPVGKLICAYRNFPELSSLVFIIMGTLCGVGEEKMAIKVTKQFLSVNPEVLENFAAEYQHQRSDRTKKSMMFFLSNVVANGVSEIKTVHSLGIFPTVICSLESKFFNLKVEALWVAIYIFDVGEAEHHNALLEHGVLRYFLQALSDCFGRNNLLEKLLHTLMQLFRKRQRRHMGSIRRDQVLETWEEIGGVLELEKLMDHPNPQISGGSQRILDEFFDSSDQDPTLQPFQNPGGTALAFQSPSPHPGNFSF